MINFNTNSFNPLANLKVSVKNTDGKSASINSSTINLNLNTTNSANATNSSQNVKNLSKNSNSNEVLGYKVDKDGFFTSEFNEKAGIPKDFKIHSSSMQQMIEQATSYKPFGIPLRTNIDIAQTIGNAYKVFSQLTNESAKSAFSADELQNLPFIYQYNKSTLEVGKTLSFDKAKSDNAINSLLAEQNGATQTRNVFLDGFFDDEIGVIHNKNEMAKYTNENGEINSGGLLVALVNANATLIESETTIMGKMLGADRHTDESALNKWFHQSELQNVIVFGEKDFMQLLAGTDLDEFQTQYKAYQAKRMQERASEKSGVGFDDALEQARKQLELLFAKHFDNQKEVKRAVETQKINIKA